MKKLFIGAAVATVMAGAAFAQDNSTLRGLDLAGEPPGAGALGPNRGDVVFPDGPINDYWARRGAGFYGQAPYPGNMAPMAGPLGIFAPISPFAGEGYYGAYGASGAYTNPQLGYAEARPSLTGRRVVPDQTVAP